MLGVELRTGQMGAAVMEAEPDSQVALGYGGSGESWRVGDC